MIIVTNLTSQVKPEIAHVTSFLSCDRFRYYHQSEGVWVWIECSDKKQDKWHADDVITCIWDRNMPTCGHAHVIACNGAIPLIFGSGPGSFVLFNEGQLQVHPSREPTIEWFTHAHHCLALQFSRSALEPQNWKNCPNFNFDAVKDWDIAGRNHSRDAGQSR